MLLSTVMQKLRQLKKMRTNPNTNKTSQMLRNKPLRRCFTQKMKKCLKIYIVPYMVSIKKINML